MALNPEQIAALRDACGQIADPITAWLLRDAAQRIAGAGKMTSTAAYELYRANALGQSKRELRKFLKKQLGLSERQIRRLFQQAEIWSVRNDLERLKLGPFTWISPQMKEITEAAIQLATADFRNLTQSLGMVSRSGQVLPLQQFYRESMDFAFKQVFTGAADYETAIRQATAKLASQGLRVIDYQSGRHTSIEAAARRNMMSAMGLLDEQITKKNHDLLGCDGWEISAHANSAPDHEPYQGRQYSDADYERLNNSLARRIGTLNCGHTASPIILGVNSPQYTEEELEKFKNDNAQGITYQGRHYTGYEATQKQRQLETAIRAQKNRILVAEAAGDETALQNARIKYQMLNREYREFSGAAGLRTQDQRALVAGFGPGEAGRASAEYKKHMSSSTFLTEATFTSKPPDDILKEKSSIGAGKEVNYVCDLDPNIYKAVTPDIASHQVIITDKQLVHIRERHPDIAPDVLRHLSEAVMSPDYIIETDMPNTANILKKLTVNGRGYQVVLRLKTSQDPAEYCDSIITFMSVNEKRWRQYLRNRKILYSRE